MVKTVLYIKLLGSLLFSILTFGLTSAQSGSQTLTFSEYIDNVVNHHPLANKANLKTKFGAAEILASKGVLDPSLISSWDQKNFDDKSYFQQYQAKLVFPTSLGVDFIAGYENNSGVFLNPENNTNNLGLWNVGIEVNVLQGLLISERRTALDQAKIFNNLAKNEQQIMLNDLIYSASSSYFNWQQNHYAQDVWKQNIDLAQRYFENTKTSFVNGEKSGMDTLEAYILYQDAQISYQKNEIELTKSKQIVENFLWFNQNPIALQVSTIPENYNNPLLQSSIGDVDQILNNHPLVLKEQNKLRSFEVDQKLKREKLKPKLKLKYNPLLGTTDNNLSPIYTTNNYKFGVDFSMPLLFRMERGELQKSRLKMEETTYEIQNKRNELRNKIENSMLQQVLIGQQLNLLQLNVEGYRRLLDGENEKFNLGESSVFLLNKRQEKYIDVQLKLIETTIKLQSELLNFLYYSNQLIK